MPDFDSVHAGRRAFQIPEKCILRLVDEPGYGADYGSFIEAEYRSIIAVNVGNFCTVAVR